MMRGIGVRLGIQRAIPWGSLQVDEVFVAGSAGEALELFKSASD